MPDLSQLKPYLEIFGAGTFGAALIYALYALLKKEPLWVPMWVHKEAITLRDARILELVKERDEGMKQVAADWKSRYDELKDEMNELRYIARHGADIAEAVIRTKQERR